jgi:hypothetical protein
MVAQETEVLATNLQRPRNDPTVALYVNFPFALSRNTVPSFQIALMCSSGSHWINFGSGLSGSRIAKSACASGWSPNGGNAGPFMVEFRLVLTQLRDVLAAEDAAIVPQKDHHRWRFGPDRPQPDLIAFRIGQTDARQPCTQCLHDGLF